MIKLVHVITSMSRGGAQSMLVKLVKELKDTGGFQQDIISLTSDCDYYDELAHLGVAVHIVKESNHFMLIKGLRVLLKSISPDILQSWMYHANFLSFFSGHPKNRIIFNVRHSLHDIRNEKPLTQAMIHIGKVLSKYIYSTVYCSKVSLEQHTGIGYSEKLSVYIPNGFDINKYRPNKNYRDNVREELNLYTDTTVIGSIARYHPMKNHVGLIQDFARYSYDFPDSCLLLIGSNIDGENNDIISMINKLNISNKVKLYGNRKDINRLMASMDIFIIPSLWGEAFPNVLGEAMSCSVPCIVSNVGDSPYILGGHGIVIQSSIYDSLCKLSSLTKQERDALGSLSRQRIIDHFSLKSITEKYLDTYKKCINTFK